MTKSYALYRLPYADEYREIQSEDVVLLYDYDEIEKYSGFCVAPFAINDSLPIVIIGETGERKTEKMNECDSNTPYAEVFEKFHSAVADGRFTKLVLSRCEERELKTGDYKSLFLKACEMYPRMMVMLVSTPVTGTWLVATPEILLEGSGDNYRTMALAGTMPFEEGLPQWSEKNKHEQKVVADYIEQTITPFATNIVKDGPHTKRAGNVVHLLTEFRFKYTIKHPILGGGLVGLLHPTPAVCGLPKQEAYEFILQNEGYDRRYYSGFMGPVNYEGETHLYVTLRCAELKENEAILYAGGGIMPESEQESEYLETENKMKTIGNVLK